MSATAPINRSSELGTASINRPLVKQAVPASIGILIVSLSMKDRSANGTSLHAGEAILASPAYNLQLEVSRLLPALSSKPNVTTPKGTQKETPRPPRP